MQTNPQETSSSQEQPFHEKTFVKAVLDEAFDPKDRIILFFIVFFWLAFIVVLAVNTSWVVLLAGIVLIGFIFIYVRIYMGNTLGLALQFESGKDSLIARQARAIAADLEITNVRVYVLKDSSPKLITLGSFQRFEIIFDSEALEVMEESEIRALLAHEMSSITSNHARMASHLRPISKHVKIPLVSTILQWSFNFWLRRVTLAADRFTILYTRDPHSFVMALIKLQVGGQFAKLFAEESLYLQLLQGSKPMQLIAETTQDIPHLTTRLRYIIHLCNRYGIELSPSLKQIMQQTKRS